MELDRYILVWVEVMIGHCRTGKLITKLDVRAARKAADGSTVKLSVPAALGRFAVDQMIWLKTRLTGASVRVLFLANRIRSALFFLELFRAN